MWNQNVMMILNQICSNLISNIGFNTCFSNLANSKSLEIVIQFNVWEFIKWIFINKMCSTFVPLIGPILELWYCVIGWSVWLLVAHELNPKFAKQNLLFKTWNWNSRFSFTKPLFGIQNLKIPSSFDLEP